MKTKLNIWSQRGLTLVGKVMISKSIGLSNLVYSMSNIEIKKRDLATSQQILSKFIWSGKPSKVKTFNHHSGLQTIRTPWDLVWRQ